MTRQQTLSALGSSRLVYRFCHFFPGRGLTSFLKDLLFKFLCRSIPRIYLERTIEAFERLLEAA
jgi:hypothetical protein